jgi:hypothetical protein
VVVVVVGNKRWWGSGFLRSLRFGRNDGSGGGIAAVFSVVKSQGCILWATAQMEKIIVEVVHVRPLKMGDNQAQKRRA